MRTKPRRDLLEFNVSAPSSEHELERFVFVAREFVAVHAEKQNRSGQRQALVAIEQCVILDQQRKECCGLVKKTGVGLNTKDNGLRAMQSGLQQPQVADSAETEFVNSSRHVIHREISNVT